MRGDDEALCREQPPSGAPLRRRWRLTGPSEAGRRQRDAAGGPGGRPRLSGAVLRPPPTGVTRVGATTRYVLTESWHCFNPIDACLAPDLSSSASFRAAAGTNSRAAPARLCTLFVFSLYVFPVPMAADFTRAGTQWHRHRDARACWQRAGLCAWPTPGCCEVVGSEPRLPPADGMATLVTPVCGNVNRQRPLPTGGRARAWRGSSAAAIGRMSECAVSVCVCALVCVCVCARRLG